VRRALKRDTFDIIHGLGYNPGVTVLGPHTGVEQSWIEGDDRSRESAAALLWARLVRFLTPRRHLIISLQRQQYADPGARAVIAISDMVKHDMMRFHPIAGDRIEVIYNGIDTGRFNPETRARLREAARKEIGLADGEVLILMVTNNFRLKGVYPAIRMLPSLRKRVRDPFRLVVVGRDDSDGYRREVERLAVEDRITFLDYVEDITPLYAAADIFFLPTFYDSCSLVVLEALAMGLPVVTTKKNGASGFLTSERLGRAVDDPRDTGAVAEALARYFPQKARDEARVAASEILPRLSSTENLRGIQEVYRRVIARKEQ
jgi:UDP-glucose:(heptosyl)LPS alpha-1,3-glucosyltransferase